jgi:hypothetical protein
LEITLKQKIGAGGTGILPVYKHRLEACATFSFSTLSKSPLALLKH